MAAKALVVLVVLVVLYLVFIFFYSRAFALLLRLTCFIQLN